MVSKARLKKIKSAAARRQSGFAVVLEDVHDPHNAAAVLRTCDAFGVQNVYFVFQKEKYYNPKKVGKTSSSSANKWLDFRIFRSTEECFKELRKLGYKIFATGLSASAESIYKADFAAGKIALVFGNEHRGISEKAARLADKIITIPMRGMVQSLNLSVTAAICIFESSRQRLLSRKKFHLSKSENAKLVRRWAKL